LDYALDESVPFGFLYCCQYSNVHQNKGSNE